MKEKETLESKEKVEDKAALEQEVSALIQVVNGLNEVYDDEVKFERVYKYIENRYEEKRKAKKDEIRNNFFFYLQEEGNQLKAALQAIKALTESSEDNPDRGQVLALIDECLNEVKSIASREVADLKTYKEARAAVRSRHAS